MGLIKRFFSVHRSESSFNDALDIFRTLRRYPVKSFQYHQVLMKIVSLCQETIKINDRHGDAHVLLANTYFLLHIDLFPENTISLPLKLAASVIQKWNDEPMRQYPWTKNIDNGRKIYDMVSNAIILNNPNLKYRIEQEMRQMKSKFLLQAISVRTLDELMHERYQNNNIKLQDQKSNVTKDDVRAIWEKWTGFAVSEEAQDKCFKASQPLQEYLWKLLEIGFNNGELERSKSHEYGAEIGALIARLSRTSFMIGLEFAKTNNRGIVPDLLKISNDPVKQFVTKLLGLFFEKGIICQSDIKELAKEAGKILQKLEIDSYNFGLEYLF